MSTSVSGRYSHAGLREGRVNQKLRTRQALLTAAAELIARGGSPSVAEVADAARISRRTAWRYFPTQEKLIAEAALDGLRPVMEAALSKTPAQPDARSAEARVEALVENMMRLAIDNEALLRTMIHATVLESPKGSQPRRGTRRVGWIEMALQPLRTQLGAAAHARLVSALAVCVGTEALLVLRDIRGLPAERAIRVSQWMAQALVRQSISESKVGRRKAGRRDRSGKSAS